MERRRVFVVGDSLFAETLAHVLTSAEKVEMTGCAPSAEAALPQIQATCPDALILACESELFPELVSRFLTADPALPLILADLDTNRVQVITSQTIGTHTSDLFAAIAVLPRRDTAQIHVNPK